MISTNDVINTNNCHISVCKTKYKNKIVILSAIDNLLNQWQTEIPIKILMASIVSITHCSAYTAVW